MKTDESAVAVALKPDYESEIIKIIRGNLGFSASYSDFNIVVEYKRIKILCL